MQEAEDDLAESSESLASLIRELQPDVLHLNQFCYGNLPVDVPRVVMAHGDLITWSRAVHERPPRAAQSLGLVSENGSGWPERCRRVVAPSAWMLEQISDSYSAPARRRYLSRTQSNLFQSVCEQGRLRASRWPPGGRQQTGFPSDPATASVSRCASSERNRRCPCRAFPSVRM